MRQNVKPLFGCLLVVACMFAGCSPTPSGEHDAKDSFRQLTSQFKERAAKRMSDQLSIIVTEQLASPDPATATIQVRKQTPSGVPGNASKTEEVIDVHFSYEEGRWRCSRAESKEFEGAKVVGQNSLGGPDIGLTNLFLWIGL
jgi:hypothetical protein